MKKKKEQKEIRFPEVIALLFEIFGFFYQKIEIKTSNNSKFVKLIISMFFSSIMTHNGQKCFFSFHTFTYIFEKK